tara:strand:+ start:318 stop:539 length:222 start_codon:yes stop_codon:yes gene_type:complete
MEEEPREQKQYMSLRAVYEFIGISKSSMRNILVSDKTFPKPSTLFTGQSKDKDKLKLKRWNRDDIVEWIESKK